MSQPPPGNGVDASLVGRALDGLCVGIVTMDAAGRVAWMNRAAQTVLGIDAEEAQERRILRLVGSGLSNQQIAKRMHVALSTVRSHLKSLYGKLGLTNRSEAISYAIRNRMTE